MRRLLVVILTGISLLSSAQEKEVVLHWSHTDSTSHFNGGSADTELPGMPIYHWVDKWDHTTGTPRLKVKVTAAVEAPVSVKKQLEGISVPDEPFSDVRVLFQRKKPMVQVQLKPWFRTVDGKLMLVTKMGLELTVEPRLAKLKATTRGSFASNSNLSSGNWFKIAVSGSGIHKITYEELQEIGVSNPATARIYGAGGCQIPEDFSEGYQDDIQAIPALSVKGDDGLFGPGDYLLFYAEGPERWSYDAFDSMFVHSLHPYSNEGFYFITADKGASQAPNPVGLATDPADAIVTSFDERVHHEEETFNLLRSGRNWYGNIFKTVLSAGYPFIFSNRIATEPVKAKIISAARSNEATSMRYTMNGSLLEEVQFAAVNKSSYTTIYASERSRVFEQLVSGDVVTLQLDYLAPNSNSEAWLDKIILNGRSQLRFSGDQLDFRDIRSVSFGSISEFRLENVPSSLVIWEITDPSSPKEISYTRSGSTAIFRMETSTLREIIAFDPTGDFPSPRTTGRFTGAVANQNLHGSPTPQMLIVTPELFLEQAQELADHRSEHDGLDVLLVTQQQVFNEFSSGTPDVGALRNFLKMYYDRSDPGEMTRYLLLFGDGSYDNRDTASYNPNYILTYQSVNSLSPTASYVSDDFYGLLDTGEPLYSGLLDIGIGRFPVSNTEEAQLMVDKVKEYDSGETFGEWRNTIVFIGDDEDGNLHMRQADELSEYIEQEYPNYNTSKIFLDAYRQETTPTGDRYPEVTRAINDQLNRGALIVNYTGHGATTGLAQEKIVDKSTIKAWGNRGKYPLFMTATCEFSRYDEYDAPKKSEATSAGEEVLLNASGGSIALFTTTRLVYSGPNHRLNEKFYEIVFEKQENGEPYRLGDIIAYSKNNVSAGVNKRNFTLLGDPSIALSFPKQRVVTDSINSIPVELLTDTISALDFVTISGHIEDKDGNPLDIDGTVVPTVFDKKSVLKTLANDGGSPMEFSTRSSILYRGNASVTGGLFSFSFYVPKDITYSIGEGRISYYFSNEDTDAHGSTETITIGGLGDFSDLDTVGPAIEVFMNDSLFRSGGIVDNSPELLLYLSDPFGINTTGNGIGHDITATLNNDRFNAIILNAYYQADKDSFSSGTVRYPYSNLPEGKHTIDVKVWDIFNNSATRSIDFVVVESTQMLLEEVYTYPNPFMNSTWFNVEHNRTAEELEVVIRIYDMNGALVDILQEVQYSSGYRLEPMQWEGKTMGGATLGGGMYLYKVVVQTAEGEQAAGSGRLIIQR